MLRFYAYNLFLYLKYSLLFLIKAQWINPQKKLFLETRKSMCRLNGVKPSNSELGKTLMSIYVSAGCILVFTWLKQSKWRYCILSFEHVKMSYMHMFKLCFLTCLEVNGPVYYHTKTFFHLHWCSWFILQLSFSLWKAVERCLEFRSVTSRQFS